MKKIFSVLFIMSIFLSSLCQGSVLSAEPVLVGDIGKIDYGTYTEGTYTASQLNEVDKSISYTSTGIYKVTSTIAGNSLSLSSRNAPGQREASVNLMFSKEVSYGRLVTDATFKMIGNSAYRSLFAISGKKGDDSNTTIKTIRYDGGKFKYDDGSGIGIKSPKTNGYGFYQLSYVLTAPDELSDWSLSIYDISSNEADLLCSIPISRSNLKTVKAGRVGYIYTGSAAQEEDAFILRSAKIAVTDIGEISEISDYNSVSQSIKIKFNTPIGDFPQKVYAKNTREHKVLCDIARGIDDTEFILTFSMGLPEDDSYTVALNKIPYKNSILTFDSEFSFIGSKANTSLYNISMTDSDGNNVINLDGITQFNFDFDWKSDLGASFYAAAYDKNGLLINLFNKPFNIGNGDGQFSFDLKNVEEIKFYIFEKDSLKPLLVCSSMGYSPEGERVEIPLTVNGGFFNSKDENISYIKNQDGISAKAHLTASNPPENLSAVLSLVRNDTVVQEASSKIIFNDENANVKVSLDSYVPQSGDKLIFTVKDNSKIYLTKWISYEDLSKTVDILLIAGQSNAEGHRGNAEESVKPDLNTVYLNTMGNTYISTEGIKGWAGSLGKTWHDRTGHTVIVIRSAKGGTGFQDGTWVPNGSGYTNAKNMYRAAIASVKAKPGYEIGKCVYFWLQGENESSINWTAEQYENAFMAMHKGFIDDFGTDSDSMITHCGILPIRSGTFPMNLKASGVRSALYDISAKNEDITMVSSATEYWNGDDGVMSWFENKYKNTYYPTGSIPIIMSNVFMDDNVHYSQKGYNELGYEAADNMLGYINSSKTSTGISILSPDGIKNYTDGDDIILPKTDSIVTIYPTASSKSVNYSLLDNISSSISSFGVFTPKPAFANSYSTLKVVADGKEMTFKVFSPILDNSISIAPVRDNKKAIYTFTGDDGTLLDTTFYHNEFERISNETGKKMTGTIALVPSWIANRKQGIATWDECRELFSDGILTVANHTMTHSLNKYVNNVDEITDEMLESEINESRKLIMDNIPGQKVLGLVFPGNWVTSKGLLKAKEQHKSIRTGSGYTKLPVTVENNLYQLHFQALMDETVSSAMNGWVDTAISNGSWLCEMWHGVRDGEDTNPNSQGYAPNKIEARKHFEYIAEKSNDIWVANWDQGICYVTERLHANVSMLLQTKSELKIEVNDDLDNSIYNEELTVNIKLPDGWENASASQGDNLLISKIENGVISINIVPDSGIVTIKKI